MADNFTANASTVTGGPVLAMHDISASSAPTTGLSSCVIVYAAATSSTQPTISCKANPQFTEITDGTNVLPTMDAAARAGFVKVTDGTNTGKVALASGALAENAATWTETASVNFAIDMAASAGSQAVPLQVESTAHPNLRTALYNGANEAIVDANGAVKIAEVGAGTVLAVSATVSASANNQTLAGSASKITACNGFCITGLGATGASNIAVTLTDGTWTLRFAVPIVAGATTSNTPFMVTFGTPLQASSTNTSIILNVPSFGTGNTSASASLWGFSA